MAAAEVLGIGKRDGLNSHSKDYPGHSLNTKED